MIKPLGLWCFVREAQETNEPWKALGWDFFSMALACLPSQSLLDRQEDPCLLPFQIPNSSIYFHALQYRKLYVTAPQNSQVQQMRSQAYNVRSSFCKTPRSLASSSFSWEVETEESTAREEEIPKHILLWVLCNFIHSLASFHSSLSIQTVGKYVLSARPYARHRREQNKVPSPSFFRHEDRNYKQTKYMTSQMILGAKCNRTEYGRGL